MADSSVKSKKKRKLTSPVDKKKKNKPLKTRRLDSSEKEELGEVEEAKSFDHGELTQKMDERRPWRNLQLILSLQSKEFDVEKKVDLAFDFVKARTVEGRNDADEDYETVKSSRLIVFVSDWIQSLLISTGKKFKIEGDKDFEACLNFKCWEIFRFCLEKSSELHFSLNLSRNLLRAIVCIAREVLSMLNAMPLPSEQTFFTGQGFEVYGAVLNCVQLLFSSESGLSNENLDLWLSTIDAIVELVCKVYEQNLEDGHAGAFVFKFSCLVLEPFSRFLRVHQTKKSGFRDFVDKLLQPLLRLLGLCHLQINENETTLGRRKSLARLLEEILSQGLFHSAHIDGFLGLRTTEKYAPSQDGKSKETNAVLQSYHRHLFDKLKSIVKEKKELELSCMGDLFCLFINRVIKQKRASNQPENGKVMEKTGISNLKHVKDDLSDTLSAETRKSLFDFFVQLMEPLLLEMRGYSKAGSDMTSSLSDVYCTLKSANSLLCGLVHERLYVKTEDISEGACLSFLKNVCDTIFSTASRLPNCNIDVGVSKMLILPAKELTISVGYLLDLEYEIVENDLVGLWLMIISYMGIGFSSGDARDQCSVASHIIKLGRQLVKLYSELRQVNNAIFALCKALKLIASDSDDVKKTSSAGLFPYTTSLPHERIAKSVEMLVSSEELRLSIRDAVISIPEGQVSGCILELTTDVLEAMEWIKVCCSIADGKEIGQLKMSQFGLQAELMGRALPEIYSLVLESLTVTTGNSNLVAVSMDNLMNVIRPWLSSLVSPHPDCINKFLLSVMGTNLNTVLAENKRGTHWFIVFFLRLCMSCRSLYRQVISLMPSKKSKKIANVMANSFAACCGNDWMNKNDWSDEGYFSWVLQPSASVLEIIICISDVYLRDNIADCSQLIYLLHAMALQRLVALNRHINSLDYLSQASDNTDLSSTRKRHKKLKKQLSVLKQEAEGLTNFMMGYLSLVVNDQDTAAVINDIGQWDFCVSAINKKSLPSALWWVICKNIDIWCAHAAKKKLKKFLSVLISASISCLLSRANLFKITGRHNIGKTSQKKKVTVHQISLELLSDSVLYENEFVHEYLASSFCHILESTALQVFKDLLEEEISFDSTPEWTEVLNRLENSVSEQPIETCMEEDALQLDIMRFTACQSLLNLLCWMPKEYLEVKSFKLYATYILNLERFIVFGLVRKQHILSLNDQHNLSSLLVSCRRTLKSIIMVTCDKTSGATDTRLLPIISDGSSLALWLSKSVYAAIGLQGVLIKDSVRKARDVIVPLMDHTSYIFLMISRSQFSSALPLFIDPEKLSKVQLGSNCHQEQNSLNESDEPLNTSKSTEACRNMLFLADMLREQAENLLNPLKDALCDEVRFESNIMAWNKLSSSVSCFGGFLWGLASTAKQIEMLNLAKLKWKREAVSKLGCCINALSKFINVFIELLFLDHDVQLKNLIDVNAFGETEDDRDLNNHNNTDLVQTQYLKKDFVQGLLRGDFAEAVFALRQLLIALSAILRLNLHINGITLSTKLVSTVTGIAQILLSGLVEMSEAPEEFTFVWLDGAIKFIEELGGHFRSNTPTLNSDIYSKLIELQLRVIGKCISLQGKEATLASHEMSFSKQSYGKNVLSQEGPFYGLCWLDEFKGRLRVSLKLYIEKSSETHLLYTMQAVERALVGVWEVCPTIYKIQTGNTDGGKVSYTVAAGIDCLDLILEHASGRKHLNVVKKHIRSLIASLFNIIVHLQSPFIFCTKSASSEAHNYPHPGSVVLMCVEVLTRVSGKHALFHMDPWHIGQSIHIPGALFQYLLQLQGNGAGVNNQCVDREFSIILYAACCRLLYTVVKHHKSETEGCLATLQESVSVLLHCLERVGDESAARKGYCLWTVEEGVKCACFLRRIYEELRQQKDVLSQHCFKFLSTYIWVYAGYGPLKNGIRRDVCEALRPGVYALIDACSPNDLQYLHTVFGEGPCRNTLASLQHDYKLNFKYEGKV